MMFGKNRRCTKMYLKDFLKKIRDGAKKTGIKEVDVDVEIFSTDEGIEIRESSTNRMKFKAVVGENPEKKRFKE